MLAHKVKAPIYDKRPANCTCYYAYWSGIGTEEFDLTMREGRAYGWVPTNDGLLIVAVFWTEEAYPQSRDDVAGTYHRILKCDPRAAERVYAGKMEGRILGTFDEPAYFRKPYGPGWALVGDAGYHKHPITTQGILDAFRDAELLANVLDQGFSGRRSLDDALADYERRRNEAVIPMYEATFQRTTLKPPPPEIQRLIAALPGNQEATDRFFGLDAGTVSIPEFFAPENVQRIVRDAGSQTGAG